MGWYVRSHAVCLCQLLLLVAVDLGKCDVVWTAQLASQRVIHWGDGFAWSAPVGVDYIREKICISDGFRRLNISLLWRGAKQGGAGRD